MAADTAALMRAGDFAIITFTKSGSSFTVTEYLGRNGEGTANAPALASTGTGACSLTWSAWTDPLDPDGVRKLSPNVSGGESYAVSASPLLVQVDRTSKTRLDILIRDNTGAPTDGTVTVIAWGGSVVSVGRYGGSLDKRDSSLEGDVPHAWGFYQQIESGLGDGFTRKRTGLVHARKLAAARAFAGVHRLAERLGNNQLPATSDERLESWEELQDVDSQAGASRHERRLRCAAKYKLALGPTQANEDAAIAELLGNAFVRTWRQEGSDLATPPTLTYWKGGTAGPASYDLGNGAWISERENLVVEVQVPPGMSETDFLYLVNVQLFRLLDSMLPSTATFNWATNVSTGFLLDISQLDWDGLT